MNNITNQVAFLRTSRNFPEDPHQLRVEINRSYVDIAEKMNSRTIGLFTANRPSITGESWFITSQKQQTFRQIYPFTSTTAINHMINFGNISQFTRIYGQFTDGTNWYGLIAGSSTAIAGQISFYLTPTQITFVLGSTPPSVSSGTVILEWLANV